MVLVYVSVWWRKWLKVNFKFASFFPLGFIITTLFHAKLYLPGGADILTLSGSNPYEKTRTFSCESGLHVKLIILCGSDLPGVVHILSNCSFIDHDCSYTVLSVCQKAKKKLNCRRFISLSWLKKACTCSLLKDEMKTISNVC